MEPIIVKGKIEFCQEENKEYNREFEARLEDSATFAYGNQTSVSIYWEPAANGMKFEPKYIDTRYDVTIKRNETDFKKWLQKYFQNNYCEHILVFN